MSKRRSRLRSSIVLLTLFTMRFAPATAAPLTIGQLLTQGWGIAGYDNRTSLILLRHAGINVLVQCSVFYEVIRRPNTLINGCKIM